uniref:hypothetical protein n=1 Tax=Algoriphagus sp. TaxID=1872435 RepID=UPI004048BA4D
MTELIVYLTLFVVVVGHSWAASWWYRKIHLDTRLTFSQKNALKLRALVFPAGLWWSFRKEG